MSNLSSKQKIIAFIVGLGVLLIVIFKNGLYGQAGVSKLQETVKSTQVNQNDQTEGVKILSTNPSGMTESEVLIVPTQALELNFNKPMVNDLGRILFEPKVKFKLEQSSDHKTLRIIPEKSFELGRGYTLTIKSGYASDRQEKLDEDIVLRFSTPAYKGV